MFTGVSFEQAIDYWKKGREVIVLDRHSQNASGGYDNFPFEELFRNVELLADVPAVENPEFKQAVADMVQSDQKQEKSSEEESSTPPSERPEVSEMLPARKGNGNQERARELAAQGMSASQIAAELGLKYNTVYYYLHPEKCSKRKKSAKPAKPAPAVKEGIVGRPGWNKDRHACKSCRYRAGGASSGCDYYVITDVERGCDPADCDRYIEGERVERKKK